MSDYNNPWDSRNKQKGDSFEKNVKDFFSKFFGNESPSGNPKKSSKLTVAIIIVALALFVIVDSVYQIQPGEQGVVLRLGRFSSLSNPGLHIRIPVVDKLYKVDIGTIRKENFGGANSRVDAVENLIALALTADKNVIKLSWVVQYKVKDPIRFLFAIRDQRAWVQDISQATMRRVVGNKTFDEVLASREEISLQTKTEMQALLDKYESGVQITTVQLQDAAPPGPVRPSFDEVNDAEQDRARLVNEAEKESNSKIPKAKGEAKKLIEEAKGYAVARVQEAKGDVALFNKLYHAYKKAKVVTRERLYIETMQEVLPHLKEVVVIDDGKKGTIPLLNIGAVSGKKGAMAIAGGQNEK